MKIYILSLYFMRRNFFFFFEVCIIIWGLGSSLFKSIENSKSHYKNTLWLKGRDQWEMSGPQRWQMFSINWCVTSRNILFEPHRLLLSNRLLILLLPITVLVKRLPYGPYWLHLYLTYSLCFCFLGLDSLKNHGLVYVFYIHFLYLFSCLSLPEKSRTKIVYVSYSFCICFLGLHFLKNHRLVKSKFPISSFCCLSLSNKSPPCIHSL